MGRVRELVRKGWSKWYVRAGLSAAFIAAAFLLTVSFLGLVPYPEPFFNPQSPNDGLGDDGLGNMGLRRWLESNVYGDVLDHVFDDGQSKPMGSWPWAPPDPAFGPSIELGRLDTDKLYVLLSLNWFLDHFVQWVILPGLLVGCAGSSLDASCKWLRKRRQQSTKQVES